MFLSYSEYVSMGGGLDQEEFTPLEYRAEKYLNSLTHERVKDETPVRQAVKYAMFDLIKIYHAASEAEARAVSGIQSQSNDGVSVTYSPSGIASAVDMNSQHIAARYLIDEIDANGTPLLYAGFEVNT